MDFPPFIESLAGIHSSVTGRDLALVEVAYHIRVQSRPGPEPLRRLSRLSPPPVTVSFTV